MDTSKRVEVGDVLPNGYTVDAVHYQRDHDGRAQGVVLAYSDHKREYAVWRLNSTNETEHGKYTWDNRRANDLYVERVNEMLHTFYNQAVPGISYDIRPTSQS